MIAWTNIKYIEKQVFHTI